MSIRQVISEIGEKYPHIESRDMVQAIDSLWPEILKSIKLPPAPSKSKITKEEYLTKRRHRRIKARPDRFATSELHQVVAEALKALNRPDVTNVDSISPNQFESSGGAHLVTRPTSFTEILTESPSDPISTLSYIVNEEEANVTPRKPRTIRPTVKFVPHPMLLETLGARVYGKFTSTIEWNTREFAERNVGTWEFALEEVYDYEESDWKRLILSVKPPIMDHAKVMELWDQLDKEIRSHLKQMTDDKLAPDSYALSELENNLFIELQF